MAKGRRTTPKPKPIEAESYEHPESKVLLRPDVGTQPQFKKKKPPQRYRYDSSLAPSLEWDGQNAAREEGEALIARISELSASLLAASLATRSDTDDPSERERVVSDAANLREAAEKLRALGKPFLNWAGKAERMSFDVPTLPLFVHERLSTKAIIETLTGHKTDKQMTMFEMFGDPNHSVTDQVLKAYEYQDKWVNRMILGDSLVVMNSLLRYESLGGQVQMIYIDPPYGVKFGSNFQPFVRKRDVKHGDDDDLTREPEMVQAYRDTWEFGLHSYLSYMRDRLLLARDLLSPTGSIFVQISDENLHHVRELMDEVFGSDNFLSTITVKKLSGVDSTYLASTADYIIQYAKDSSRTKYRQLFAGKTSEDEGADRYDQLELVDGKRRPLLPTEKDDASTIPPGARRFQLDNLVGAEFRPDTTVTFDFEGKAYHPGKNSHWKTSLEGMELLAAARRLQPTAAGSTLRYVRFLDDFPAKPISNIWNEISGSIQSRSDPKIYVVQTSTAAIQRAVLMSTDPGDLVLDPTCGSGTTAYVAEQWGRRWITCDVSRVPLALARQRLLTATFDWHELKDDARGPGSGFVYKRKQNKKGEEVGGIVPHVTLKSIANNEPPAEEVLVDRPEKVTDITRVTGPFTFEATIPTPVDFDGDGVEDSGIALDDRQSFTDRMLEVLRRSPLLRLDGNKTVKLANIRPPAKTLALSAEAVVEASATGKATLEEVVAEAVEKNKNLLPFSRQTVALVFGPENGAVSEKLVYQAAKEATAKSYSHLYVIGFAIQPNARALIEQCEAAIGIAATYVQATPDLLMGDLLKNMRSSQIFSVCGLPEVTIRKIKSKEKKAATKYEVELLGLDVFDPVTMQTEHRSGDDVPAWFLDADYNDLCFHVSQAFFPRTGAWESLKKSLKAQYDESVWDHLAGTTSAPFEAGDHGQIAVKVIDDRGNELVVVKKLGEAS